MDLGARVQFFVCLVSAAVDFVCALEFCRREPCVCFVLVPMFIGERLFPAFFFVELA